MADLTGQKAFSDIYGEVGEEVLDESASTTTNPSLVQVKRYINRAYREVVSEFPFWFKYAKFSPVTVAGTSVVTMDDTLARIESVMIPSQNIRLNEVTREDINSKLPGAWNNVGNSIPTVWVPAERASNNALQIELYPTPDAVYTLEIWGEKRFADLSADADVPIIPPEWQDVMINKAMMYAFMKISDTKAEDWRQLYMERFESMWLDYQKSLSGIRKWRDANRNNSIQAYPGLYFPYLEGQ